MEAPKLPSIFKQNQARGFNFKPLYYDERKERLEKLKKKYENAESSTLTHEEFRERIASKWGSERKKATGASNIRLLLIIVVLTFLAYLIII